MAPSSQSLEPPQNPGRFIIFATKAAFESEAVREELGYAIDRTLKARGERFPLIALLADADAAGLPASLRIRLAVPLSADDWDKRIMSGLSGTSPGHR
ncbi:MAG: hypothetical protein GXP36_08110, partial [Actinobacteria bacterium]|nr:hypothetical protein [Actinomycetota bacterium]